MQTVICSLLTLCSPTCKQQCICYPPPLTLTYAHREGGQVQQTCVMQLTYCSDLSTLLVFFACICMSHSHFWSVENYKLTAESMNRITYSVSNELLTKSGLQTIRLLLRVCEERMKCIGLFASQTILLVLYIRTSDA